MINASRGRGVLRETTRYAVAALVPSAVTFVVASLQLPAFVFEHTIVLLVVLCAARWGVGPATLAAAVAVSADNLLLREPIGRPAITGMRDVLDLVLFLSVAVTVAWLVATARRERRRAEEAAQRERAAREERDRIIATVSHDLATPLSVLSGSLAFVRRLGPNAHADLPRLMARLETAASRATSLVKTLADAQALETQAFALKMQTVELGTLVGPIADMLEQLSERHNVVFTGAEAPILVQADAERLQRVVENLVNNAIKYSPDGGQVEVSVSVEDREAVVRVRDYGIGISPEALPHIFHRTYRAPEAARTAPGLGLGLSIAAQIVALHGGTIQAQPADSRGTIFSLRLPLIQSEFEMGAATAARQGVGSDADAAHVRR